MHCGYEDIVSRVAEPPKWWDEHAVPRYCDFSPEEAADIYANEVALVEIACQACDNRFHVCFSWGAIEIGFNEDGTAWTKRHRPLDAEDVQRLHYGDPPNFCCGMGATMNSTPIRVVELWRRHDRQYVGDGGVVTNVKEYFKWRRVAELEVCIHE